MAEKKPLSFKDFMTVEYRPGEDDLVNYRAYRRRRTESTDTPKNSITLDEVLSISGRRKMARLAKRRKTMLKIARKKRSRVMARDDRLKVRSRRSARKAAGERILKGRKKGDLSDAAKAALERRLSQPAFQRRLDIMQRRLMPNKRREEIARRKGHKRRWSIHLNHI